MPDAVEVAIESALINRAVAFAAAQSPALTIQLPNVGSGPGGSGPFTPPTAGQNVKWLRATFLPADSFALAVGFGGSNQHYGLFQVDVFHAQGAGEYAPGRIATALIAWFPRGNKLTKDGFTVEIGVGSNIPRRRAMVKDDPWVFIPVQIPYRTFAPGPA